MSDREVNTLKLLLENRIESIAFYEISNSYLVICF